MTRNTEVDEVRALTSDETDSVSGGILPIIILGELFAIGFGAGVVAHNVKNNRPWFEW